MKTAILLKQMVTMVILSFLYVLPSKADVGAIQFTGAGDSGMNCLETTLASASITLETWLYVDTNTGFFASNMANDKGFLLGFDGWFKFQMDDVSVWIDPTDWKGKWTHLACVADGTDLIVYVNGKQVGSTASSGYNTSSDGNPMYLGRAPWGNPINGQLADFRLWNKARSADDIQADYARQIASDSEGLLIHYHFLEGEGDNTVNLVNPERNRGWFMGTAGTSYEWSYLAKTPTNLKAENKSLEGFDLLWEGLEGNTWGAELTNALGETTEYNNLLSSSLSLTGLSAGKYSIRVKVTAPVSTQYSTPLEVEIEPNGLENQSASEAILSKKGDQLLIEGISGHAIVSVHHLNGSIYRQLETNEPTLILEIAQWEQGVYFIQLKDSKCKSWKFILQN